MNNKIFFSVFGGLFGGAIGFFGIFILFMITNFVLGFDLLDGSDFTFRLALVFCVVGFFGGFSAGWSQYEEDDVEPDNIDSKKMKDSLHLVKDKAVLSKESKLETISCPHCNNTTYIVDHEYTSGEYTCQECSRNFEIDDTGKAKKTMSDNASAMLGFGLIICLLIGAYFSYQYFFSNSTNNILIEEDGKESDDSTVAISENGAVPKKKKQTLQDELVGKYIWRQTSGLTIDYNEWKAVTYLGKGQWSDTTRGTYSTGKDWYDNVPKQYDYIELHGFIDESSSTKLMIDRMWNKPDGKILQLRWGKLEYEVANRSNASWLFD